MSIIIRLCPVFKVIYTYSKLPRGAISEVYMEWLTPTNDHAKHFWFKLNFLLPKNESVLNILMYFLEQFQRFSRGLQPLENL